MAAAALKIAMLICVSAVVLNHAQGASHHAPAPAVDCSSLILNMADCLSFVSNGSAVTKPEGTCCNGLKTVLKADASCLCEAFKSSAQLGVVLNVTKAMSLPAACKISAPSAANCGLSITPAGAPALSPPESSSPASTIAAPQASITAGAVNGQAPALAPTPGSQSASSALSISVKSVLVGLVVASLSWL